MQFLGRIHEVYLEALSKHFKADTEAHLNLDLDKNLCDKIVSSDSRVFLAKGIDTHFEAKPELLDIFDSYEKAYYQLVFEISKKVNTAIDLILDKNTKLKDIYISGGFNRNEIFVQFLKLLKPDVSIKIPKAENESALGAAVLMKDYL